MEASCEQAGDIEAEKGVGVGGEADVCVGGGGGLAGVAFGVDVEVHGGGGALERVDGVGHGDGVEHGRGGDFGLAENWW